MRAVYPVVFTPMEEGGYLAFVPDLDINTSGKDLADAIYMARDAISLWGICEQDMGRIVPEPSSETPPHGEHDVVSLVDVDFSAYRKAQDMRAVRKNVTIPSYLDAFARKRNINFSKVLTDALTDLYQAQS